ncbi:hypothetical protein GCM10008098_29050 [Rhodanobacter panaciterrae]|uniref:Uncharacterized protein n=1 Tax=Rhodanobacter panaciterrae TaxID=490572 RepID=A0ABQ3A2X0_9GAMM|nr:hypothetical protein [Rhodanobacter panaciterrae]GGY33881.1 hypothetical protein GCM10008098_29050 [Rhodanobacter panaciterrae]
MTHSLDFVGLNKKLFLLRHLIAGNKEFSRREQQYQGTQAEPSEGWDQHAARLQYMVSNDLIEIAAKFRVMQDTASIQLSSASLRELDHSCLGKRSIGTVLSGDVELTLRESCNKIIHASKFQLIFQNARSAVPRHLYSYWNGICQFSGSQGKNNWRIALDVYRWADAMDCFLEELAGNVDS